MKSSGNSWRLGGSLCSQKPITLEIPWMVIGGVWFFPDSYCIEKWLLLCFFFVLVGIILEEKRGTL